MAGTEPHAWRTGLMDDSLSAAAIPAVAQGFDAKQIGAVVAWTGLPQLRVIPLVPLFMKRIDARLLAETGLLVFPAFL